MAKAAQVEALALETLGRMLGDPAPRVLHGSKGMTGVFAGGSAAEKAAAKLCLDNGWLTPTGETSGKGKSKKPLYRLANVGVQAILARSDPTPLLESLRSGIDRLDDRTTSIVQQVQESLAGVLETVKTAMHAALQPLAPLHDMRAIKQNLALVLEKVKPVNVSEILSKLPAAATVGAADNSGWHDAVISMVAGQRQQNPFQRLTLPQIFDRLKAERPKLSLGEFHDGLRHLHQQGRLRLGPYTQALATLDDPRNALYLDREVKYYVELP